MAVTIQKSYIYKVYRGSTFLGVLQNVTSEFSYTQDINSSAVQINVEVNASADVADAPLSPLLDESGNNLLDESGNILYEERSADVVGAFSPLALIQENNRVKVREVSDYNTSGKLVFDGYIQSWNASLGSADDKINFTAISNSVDLADYVITTGSTTAASNVGDNTEMSYTYWAFAVAQTIVPTGPIDLDQIAMKFRNTSPTDAVTIQAYLCQGDPSLDSMTVMAGTSSYSFGPGNGIVDTFASASVPANQTTATEKTLSLPATRTLATATSYYILVYWGASAKGSMNSALQIYVRGTTVAASSPLGRAYFVQGTINNSTFGMYVDATVQSAYIKLITANGNTISTYSSVDPSAILTDIMDFYIGAGGTVTYTSSTVATTGVTASYTFKLNTILEGIKKCLELAPDNWYWYVDPGLQVLYFKQTATTATHKFTRGRHLEQISIGGTVEDVRNVVYFSGGDTGGGVNLFSYYSNATSITTQLRRRLERLSDNRVTLQATADLIADNYLDQHSGIVYNSPITISAATYDISTINVGDTIQIFGFGNFLDGLMLQAARIARYPDKVVITLGVILQRQSDALSKALDQLDKLQTIDNPSTPS